MLTTAVRNHRNLSLAHDLTVKVDVYQVKVGENKSLLETTKDQQWDEEAERFMRYHHSYMFHHNLE